MAVKSLPSPLPFHTRPCGPTNEKKGTGPPSFFPPKWTISRIPQTEWTFFSFSQASFHLFCWFVEREIEVI